MPNLLEHAVSPYLRLHADNPVDWREWGPAAFAEARERDVPVLVSIGYATCHWCHVMARESFSDPGIGALLRRDFVAVKVDREERPDVDASCMMAASAFTEQLGWPLTVFTTPEGRVFYAGTYYPPTPVGQHPSFRQVLDAVQDAWTNRRDEVHRNADGIAAAISARSDAAASAAEDGPADGTTSATQELPSPDAVHALVPDLVRAEDPEFSGFGGGQKFPNAPLLELLAHLAVDGDAEARGLVERTLRAIAGSELRDRVDGGIFRYATRRDWSVPHYERMLYDNGGLLAVLGVLLRTPAGESGEPGEPGDDTVLQDMTLGIARFLRETLRTSAGSFVAAQDSESTIDGERVEGAYYMAGADERASIPAPPLDDQVLTGWNGLAIRGLALAASALDDAGMLDDARRAADAVLAAHVQDGRVVVRASTPRGTSPAGPTLEDVGLLADGLVELALATGEVCYAEAARAIVEPLLVPAGPGGSATLRLAGGGDEVLAAAGVVPVAEQPQTALRSGTVALASAAWRLGELTGSSALTAAAQESVAARAREGLGMPLGHADALALAVEMGRPSVEIVVVLPELVALDPGAAALRAAAIGAARPGVLVSVVTAAQARAFAAAGFDLYEGRSDVTTASAFVCHDRVCDLPVTSADALRAAAA